MGEGRNPGELENALLLIRGHGLKTCLYTGSGCIAPFQSLLCLLDYIKLGGYVKDLGGLESAKTNQRFYRIEKGTLIDETYRFQRKKD